MIRLGVVSFLNSRPLIEGLTAERGVELIFDVPALLPGRLARGEVDAALIPIVDVLRSRGRYRVVSDACIGCDGETMTVRVFSQTPPDRVRRLWVDPDSHTSVALAAIIWRELWGVDLNLLPCDPRSMDVSTLEAVLLIGDKVVDPRRGSFAYEVDLGGAWRQHTGLPFVFAVWAARSDDAEPGEGHVAAIEPAGERLQRDAELDSHLRTARELGVARAEHIARQAGPLLGWPVELADRYLRRCLKYTLTPRFVEGANLFGRLCAARGLVPEDATIRWPDDLDSEITVAASMTAKDAS